LFFAIFQIVFGDGSGILGSKWISREIKFGKGDSAVTVDDILQDILGRANAVAGKIEIDFVDTNGGEKCQQH
jgi:hypothetical protein